MRSGSRPKVLFLGTTSEIGGLEAQVLSLSRQFNARGWRTRTVFPLTSRSAPLLEWSHAQGVPAEASAAVREVVAPHSMGDLLRLRRLIRRSGADVVNLHYGGGHIALKDILAVRLAGRARCVASVLHPVPWEEAGGRKRRLTRVAAGLADSVVTISRATRDVLLEAGVPAQKLHLIPCGVPLPARRPLKAQARAELGLPAEAFVVATLARLTESKAVDVLIEAVARLYSAVPRAPVWLLVAGDGEARPALERQAAAALPGRCRFLGRAPDTAPVYAAADVFALPSPREGFGLVYVEAALHGVPSVGCASSGVTDVIAHGETGLLVPPGDAEALAGSLHQLADDPGGRRRMGAAARALALAEFTEPLMAERYDAVFRGGRPAES